MSAKQIEVFNCYKRFMLCSGGRHCGKTVAVCHRIWRHLWETQGALVAVIARTIKSAKEGGAWADLVGEIGSQWVNSGLWGKGGAIGYTSEGRNGLPGPRMDAATRTSSFRIRNMYGGESECLLFSIDNEDEIEAKTKGQKFSMIWVSELANFKSEATFSNLTQNLRSNHLEDWQMQFIADTNPAEDGEDSWIYKKWFIERLKDDHPFPLFRDELCLFEFKLEDNREFMSDMAIEILKGTNCDNQGDYDRNVLGLWRKGFGLKDKVFADIIDISRHFIEPSIDIDEATIELITGWDMGQVNSAAAIVEKRFYKEMSHYMVLDEVVTIDERISTEEFAFQVYEKMNALSNYYGKRFLFRNWSDTNAFDFRASQETIDATIVHKATDGEVELVAVDKPKDSVKAGIKIMRRLIRENRLYAGNNCPKIKEMLMAITNKDIDEDTFLKHPFDAVRYIIYMEERKNYFETAIPKGVDRSQPKLISF